MAPQRLYVRESLHSIQLKKPKIFGEIGDARFLNKRSNGSRGHKSPKNSLEWGFFGVSTKVQSILVYFFMWIRKH